MVRTTEMSQAHVLIAGSQGLVRNIAWKIHRRLPPQIELEELISYGQLGLLQAANRFDADRGIRFTTFAYYRIRGAIFDGLSEMSWFTAREYHQGRYEQFAGDLLESDSHESGDASDNAADHAAWLTEVSTRLAVVSIMTSAGGGYGDQIEGRGRNAENPVEHAQLGELNDALRSAVADLPDQQRSLVELAYFEGLSLKVAGERLGISKSWASRLHDRALRALSENLMQRGVA